MGPHTLRQCQVLARDKDLLMQVIYLEAVLAMLPPWMRMKAHSMVEVADLAGTKVMHYTLSIYC